MVHSHHLSLWPRKRSWGFHPPPQLLPFPWVAVVLLHMVIFLCYWCRLSMSLLEEWEDKNVPLFTPPGVQWFHCAVAFAGFLMIIDSYCFLMNRRLIESGQPDLVAHGGIPWYNSLGCKGHSKVIQFNPWNGTSSTRLVCSDPRPTWPWMFPGVEAPLPTLWEICSSASPLS